MAKITTITNPLTGQPAQVDQLDHTAQEIDDAIARALPGGAIDIALQNKAPSGYGLGTIGGVTENLDADKALANGWYQCQVNVPFISWTDIFVIGTSDGYNVHQFAFDRYASKSAYGSCYMHRSKADNGAFSEWEWVNPPMAPGVEYRTMERYLGKPVYVKVVDCGNLPASGLKNIAHGIANCKPIQVYGEMSNGNTLPYTTTTNYCISADANYIQIYVTGDLSGQTVKATMKCTKTTD